MINCYRSSDNAGFTAGRWEGYYGSDEVDPITQDWCFILKRDGREVFRATNEQLLNHCPEESPLGLLVAGFALYMSKK